MSQRRTKLPTKPSLSNPPSVLVPRGGGGGRHGRTKLAAASAPIVFDNGPLWLGSAVIVAINALGWCISAVAPQCHYHVDFLGCIAFAVAAQVLSLRFVPTTVIPTGGFNLRIWCSATAVTLWSVRLATFLLYRIIQKGHDGRVEGVLATPGWAAVFWIISAAWGVLCSLPYLLGTTSSVKVSASSVHQVALFMGAILFAVGFATETVADYQKWTFKQKHPSGQFCNVGLWSISQHPNWLGNLLLWSGIFVMNAPALIDPTAWSSSSSQFPYLHRLWKRIWSVRRLALALLGPAFMWSLFHAQARGRMLGESLQATMDRYGYGNDPVFTKYVDTTPLIVPNPLEWFRAR